MIGSGEPYQRRPVIESYSMSPAGHVRGNQLEPGGWLFSVLYNKTLPFSLLQDVSRNKPPGSDAVCVFSTFVPERRRSAARTRYRYQPRNGAVLVEQIWPYVCCREFSFTVSTTRTSNIALPTNANLAEIRLHQRLSPQSFQRRKSPLLTLQFQAEPFRCSHRVASTLFSIGCCLYR